MNLTHEIEAGGRHIFTATKGGVLVAILTADPFTQGEDCGFIVHNIIRRWGRQIAAEYREMFDVIRAILRRQGRLLITNRIVSSETEKWIKFLQFMGWHCFTEITYRGLNIRIAAMEA